MNTTKTTTRKIGQLKQDPAILDLRPVNPLFVSRYRQAMRNGDEFPPLIIDQDDNIVSGNHRFESYLGEFGENHEVPVTVKKYKSPVERIEDAIRDNARHGCAMDGITRKRAVLILSQFGRTPEAIAKLLGVTAKRVEEMAGLSVIVIGGKGEKQTTEPVKRGLEHMAGKKVTRAQYESHRHQDRGVPAAQSARQLIRWIANEWVDWTDADNVAALSELHAAIGAKI
jgi:hypothetical protein